jgi:hypothetical protein
VGLCTFQRPMHRCPRFEMTEVFDAGYCRCNRCRKRTGAPVFAFVDVPRAAFGLLSGELVAEPWEGLGQGMICGAKRCLCDALWRAHTATFAPPRLPSVGSVQAGLDHSFEMVWPEIPKWDCAPEAHFKRDNDDVG